MIDRAKQNRKRVNNWDNSIMITNQIKNKWMKISQYFKILILQNLKIVMNQNRYFNNKKKMNRKSNKKIKKVQKKNSSKIRKN